ncbi:MAG TPA: sialidase family protein, partial [Ilumatobacteraceae bacterium]|nr:sialidase family protein [Ilumatobacteraceae bacterium]
TAYDAGVVGNPLRANSDGAIYWLLERINGIIVSHDNGETWALIEPLTETLPTFPTLLELFDGSLASIANDRVIVSRDHGASWSPVSPSIPYLPSGITYSPFRKAFYVWHFDCDFTTEDPILANSIIRLDYDPTAV